MRNALPVTVLTLFALPLGCGDDATKTVDAHVDAPADASGSGSGSGVNFDSFEGGEVRLEYLQFPPGNATVDRTRATAFFFKGTPVHYPFPVVPGCTRYTAAPPDTWPIAQDPNRQYLDTGHVILTSANGAGYGSGDPTGSAAPIPLDIPPGVVGAKDFLDRQYTGPWKSAVINGTVAVPVGHTYIHDHTPYNVEFTGSPEWPAQAFSTPLYMPDYFSLISPDVNTVSVPLPAGQPMTFTFGEPTTQPGLPAGATVTTLVAFTNGNPPALLCVLDNTSGTLTVSAADIDFVRATVPGGGRLLRQNVVHQLRELTDGVTHQNRRIDFIGVWCFNYPFTVP